MHSHPLPQDIASSLPYERHHHIPADLHEWASALQGFRLPSDLHAMMCKLARDRGEEITWTADDVRNRYGASKAAAWDVDQFLRKMIKSSTTYDYRVGEDGVLQLAYWAVNEDDPSVTVSSREVLIFDNTFNTTKYGYKLGFFSTVDRKGLTRIKSATIMRRETVDSFKWVMHALLKDMKTACKVLLTDGDLWMAEAVELVLGAKSSLPPTSQMVHLLCTWHLSMTLFRHVKNCFGGDLQKWQSFLRQWWKLCQNGELARRITFDRDWAALKSYLRSLLTESQQASGAFVHALAFLGGPLLPWEEDLLGEGMSSLAPDLSDYPPADGVSRFATLHDLRHKWAARFTYQHFTHGASSTSRGEQCFATFKSQILAGSSLCNLWDSLIHILESSQSKYLTKLPRMILRSAARDSTLQPLIQHLIKMGAAPFLVNMAEAILARVQMYKVTEAPRDQAHLPILERTFLVCHHTVSFEASLDADLLWMPT